MIAVKMGKKARTKQRSGSQGAVCMSVTLQAKSLGKSSCRSLLVDCAHGALANEAEVLRVVGRQLAAGRVEDTGHHIPVPLEALAIDVSELCTGFLIPVHRCQLQRSPATSEYVLNTAVLRLLANFFAL